MVSLAILGFGLVMLFSGRCPISGSYGLKGTGARLAGVAVIAWGFNVFNFIALPISALCGGMETTAGILAYYGVPIGLVGLIVAGLVRKFGNAYAGASLTAKPN